MGVLAYDPERLGLLAAALGDAADALAALRSGDAEAQPGLAVAGHAATAFTAWRTRLLAIASCGALTDYVPVALDPTHLPDATAYVLAQGYGWRTTTDPRGSRAFVPPAMRGASIGHLLAVGALGAATPAEAAALRAELDAVLLDPAAQAAFAANLTAAGAAPLADRLAEERATAVWQGGGPAGSDLDRDPALGAQVAGIDAIAAILAAVLVAPGAALGEAREALARVRPATAALLVGRLGPEYDDALVAGLAVDTLLRYRASFAGADPPAAWEVRDRLHLGPGDLLFPRIAAGSPAAAHDLVVALLRQDPTLLLVTVREPSSTAGLVLRATDPAAIAPAAAGSVIEPYLALVREPPASPWLPAGHQAGGMEAVTLRPTLGPLIAPWLLQFAGRADEWAWSRAEAAAAFRFVIDDETAFADLAAAADRWGDAMALTDVAAPRDLLANLTAMAVTLGTVRELLNQRGARRIADDRIPWDFVVAYLPKAARKGIAATGLTGLPARAAAKVAALAIAQGAALAEERGLPGAPPPLEDALRHLDVADDEAAAVAAYVAMGLMVDALVAAGRLPAGADWPPPPVVGAGCPTADYATASADWLARAFPDDDEAFGLVAAARGAFISDGQSAAECIELTYG